MSPSMLSLFMEIIVRPNERLCRLKLIILVLPRRLFHGFYWGISMLFRSFDEKCGGTTSWLGWKNGLNNCVLQSCIEDLRFMGSRFAWTY